MSRTVSEDDAHRGNNDDRSVGAFAVKARTFGATLCGIGLDRSARPSKSGDRPLQCSGNQRTLLSDNVRQVECWFSQTQRNVGINLALTMVIVAKLFAA
jgi:hypothetical protein